jgi:hypothetical protein
MNNVCYLGRVPICSVCHLPKPANQFPRRKPNRREARCKACNSLGATATAHRRRPARMSAAEIEERIAQLAAALDRCQKALTARRSK